MNKSERGKSYDNDDACDYVSGRQDDRIILTDGRYFDSYTHLLSPFLFLLAVRRPCCCTTPSRFSPTGQERDRFAFACPLLAHSLHLILYFASSYYSLNVQSRPFWRRNS